MREKRVIFGIILLVSTLASTFLFLYATSGDPMERCMMKSPDISNEMTSFSYRSDWKSFSYICRVSEGPGGAFIDYEIPLLSQLE
ncbi:hypothetical protein DEAB109302_11140 [Dermacoccus abyssi]